MNVLYVDHAGYIPSFLLCRAFGKAESHGGSGEVHEQLNKSDHSCVSEK